MKRVLPLPIPEVIYAMIIFFVLLQRKIIKVNDYEEIAAGVLSLMALYFVPPASGLIESYKYIMDDILAVALIIIGSTLITFSVTAFVVKKLTLEEEEDGI